MPVPLKATHIDYDSIFYSQTFIFAICSY